ncbi:helix-turn-helix domain-containing protein [Salicibibacter cibi]|uniref:Helix-turn-helix domain-containing protein n=1 Tax=Salicibibacter cibi TaxID=2743001 RepID=A0A7T6ZC38_9BACI|nr:helix-turn-helix domain-containing protein [Salicibibacter cibi]QQK80728.1 helix-turn-helix domain-containing protein [Salicibibacter cibi]
MCPNLSNADLCSYKSLSPFTNVEELNRAIRIHLYAHSHELTENAVAVFKLIARHAVKTVGVAFLKYDVMATHLGVSSSTVKRIIRVLKERQMIDVYRTVRQRGKVRGGYGHNVFLIVDPSTDPSEMNHRSNPENTDASNVQPEQKETEALSFEAGSLSEKKEPRKAVANEKLDASFVPAHVPPLFVTAAQPFYDAEYIYNLWGRAVSAYKYINTDADLMEDDIVHAIVQAFKGAMFMQKTGRLRGSLAGYFYGACKRIFEQIYQEELDELWQQRTHNIREEDLPGWLTAD